MTPANLAELNKRDPDRDMLGDKRSIHKRIPCGTMTIMDARAIGSSRRRSDSGSPYGVLLNEVRFAIPNELFQHNNIRRRRNCVQHLGASPWDGRTRDHAPTRFRCGLRRLPPGSPPAPGAGIHNRAQLKPRADPTEFNRSSIRDAAKHIDRSCSRRYRPSSRTPLVQGRSDPAGSSSVARLLNSGPDCADRLRGRSP